MAWISSRVQSFLNGPLAWIAAADKAGPAVVVAAAADDDCTDARRVGVAVLYRRRTERKGCVARRTADMFDDADSAGRERKENEFWGSAREPKKFLAHEDPAHAPAVPRSLFSRAKKQTWNHMQM